MIPEKNFSQLNKNCQLSQLLVLVAVIIAVVTVEVVVVVLAVAAVAVVVYTCICILLQLASLQRLELENQEAAKQLEDVVSQGETLLVQIQLALHDIAQSQLQSQMLETSVTVSSASSASSSKPE